MRGGWLARWIRRRQIEAEWAAEMEQHVEERRDELRRRNPEWSETEALRQARLEFGSRGARTEEVREAMGWRPLDELMADGRYALRGFRRNPGFAAVAVLVLAAGCGVNTAFYGFYNSFVVRPLAIRAPERHYRLEGVGEHGERWRSFTRAEMEQLRQAAPEAWEGLYAERTRQAAVLAPEPRPGFFGAVSANYFDVLGGRTARGRSFQAGEERTPVVVLSDSGWRRLLGGEAGAVGKTVQLRDTRFTVIGIAEPSFTGTELTVPDGWIPLAFRRVLAGEEAADEERYAVGGLLREGVSAATAEAAMSATAARLDRAADEKLTGMHLKRHGAAADGEEDLDTAGALVGGVFGALLLIACANLASLQLARAAARSHEIGVRLSLGASRARVVRQLMTESLLLAAAGAALGLALAAAGSRALHGYFFSQVAEFGIQVTPVEFDWRVGVYTGGLAGLAGLAFGLLPALQATAPSLTAAARREHSAFAGRVRPHRLRDLLLSTQVAVSLVLLLLSGVLVRNLQKLSGLATGYDIERVLDARLDGKPTAEFVAALQRDPRLQAVAAAGRAPLSGWMPRETVTVGNETRPVQYNHIDEAYFDVLGLRPVRGRFFTRQEAQAGAPVAVVSEATARRLWPGRDPLGQVMRAAGTGAAREVVGVAPDVVSGILFVGPDPTMVYYPAAAGTRETGSVLLRARDRADAALKAALADHCAAQQPPALCPAMSLREMAGMQQFPFQAAAGIASGLGLLALGLTAIGLFGVVSYGVAQRTREIGIRRAIGATPGGVVRLLVREAMRRVGWGLAAGLPLAAWAAQWTRASALRIETFDPGAWAAVPLLLLGVSAVAGWIPARRAAEVDPAVALRDE